MKSQIYKEGQIMKLLDLLNVIEDDTPIWIYIDHPFPCRNEGLFFGAVQFAAENDSEWEGYRVVLTFPELYKSLGGVAARQSRAHTGLDDLHNHLIGQAVFHQDVVGHALFLPDQAQQQMLRTHISVAQLPGRFLRKPQGFFRPGREFIFIHGSYLPFLGSGDANHLLSFCSLCCCSN